MTISDFIYIQEEGILFAGFADYSMISKVEGIFSMLKSKSNQESRGMVICYKEETPKSFNFKKIWKIDFKSPVILINKIK